MSDCQFVRLACKGAGLIFTFVQCTALLSGKDTPNVSVSSTAMVGFLSTARHFAMGGAAPSSIMH